jgi:hypothetical protein
MRVPVTPAPVEVFNNCAEIVGQSSGSVFSDSQFGHPGMRLCKQAPISAYTAAAARASSPVIAAIPGVALPHAKVVGSPPRVGEHPIQTGGVNGV